MDTPPARRRFLVAAIMVFAAHLEIAPTLGCQAVDADALRALIRRARALEARGELLAAQDAAESALRLADQTGAARLRAEAADTLGSVFDNQGRAEEAERWHRHALALAREAGDRGLEARLLAATASGCWRRAEYGRALDLAGRALKIHEGAGDSAGQAQALVLIGRVHFKRGAYAEAVDHHRRALALFVAAGDAAGQATALEDLGDVFTDVHSFAQALWCFQQAGRLWAILGNRENEARLATASGVCWLRQGAILEARQAFETATRLATAAGDPATLAMAMFHLGLGELMAGREADAVAHVEVALELRHKFGDRREEAWCHDRLALALSRLGELRRALGHYLQAIDLREQATDLRNLAGTLEDAAQVHEKLGELGQALALYRRALALGDQIDLPYASSTAGRIGVALAKQGDFQGALAAGRDGVERTSRLASPSLAWQAHYRLGVIERLVGRPLDALRSLGTSLGHIERMQRSVAPSPTGSPGYLDDRLEVFAETASLLIRLDRSEDALEVAERARSTVLRGILSRREEGPWSQAFRDSAALAARDGAMQQPHPAAPETRQLLSIMETPRPAPTALLSRALHHDRTVVEYLCSDERILIWVMRPSQPVRAVIVPAGAREIARWIERMRHALRTDALVTPSPAPPSGGPAASILEPLHALHRLLIVPIQGWLPQDPSATVLLVPHGPLFLVPFSALIDDDGHYLVERHTLATAPALAALSPGDRKSRRAKPHSNGTVLVGYGAAVTDPTLVELEPLPGVEEEVSAIARRLAGRRVVRLTGTQATVGAVRREASNSRWIHLASHAALRDDDPISSSLLLAPTDKEDGQLTISEVLEFDLDADLVVLSACSTGLGRLSGDGVDSFARAFLLAGAKDILVTLWPVADAVAPFEMERLYGALADGRSTNARALRHAQVETINALRQGQLRLPSGAVLVEHPALWAPFVLVTGT